jgi:hypothetical protein
MFRFTLTVCLLVALSGAGIGTAADSQAGRPDGRLLPDGADLRSTTPPSRPDDRGDRFTRPDGRTVPDAVDARNAVTPVVIRVDGSGATPFDWLAALIGGLAVGGLALATGGLLVLRRHGPTPAR